MQANTQLLSDLAHRSVRVRSCSCSFDRLCDSTVNNVITGSLGKFILLWQIYLRTEGSFQGLAGLQFSVISLNNANDTLPSSGVQYLETECSDDRLAIREYPVYTAVCLIKTSA